MTKEKELCVYPNCKKKSEFMIRKNLRLCETHYDLFKFIDKLIFECDIDIDLKRSRFADEGEE